MHDETDYYAQVIHAQNEAMLGAHSLISEAQRMLAQRQREARTALTEAIARYPFSDQNTVSIARLIVPTLFMAPNAMIPGDLNLMKILETLEYNLSAARNADPLQVPFYLRIEHKTAGLTKRGGPMPGDSFERENDATTVILGYLRTLSLHPHNNGEFPAVRLHVHRCIIADMNLENLTAPVHGADVGEERTGVISLTGYQTKYPMFFNLFGPHLSACLCEHLGSGTGVHLLIGKDLIKAGFASLPHSEIVTAMAGGVGMALGNPA